jgi:PTH1 family peptidyl-tRNA hydrolase
VDSIITHLGSLDFPRLRVGIGRPPIIEDSAEDREAEVVAYVLNDFTPEERKTITQVIPKVSEAILNLLNEGLTAAMNKYN